MMCQSGPIARIACFVVLMSFFQTSIGIWNFEQCGIGLAGAATLTKSGHHIAVEPDRARLTVHEHDLTLPLPDSGALSFERIYVNESGISRVSHCARLGVGWTHNFAVDSKDLSGTSDDTAVRFFYEGQPEDGKLTKVQPRDGTGIKLTLRYDGSDRLTKAAIVENRSELDSVTYRYDAAGRLTEAVKKDGNAVRYGYEKLGHSDVLNQIADETNGNTQIAWSTADGTAGVHASSIEVTEPNGDKEVYQFASVRRSDETPP